MSHTAAKPKSMIEIQNWMVAFVATELNLSTDEIPIDEPLVNLGMSSRQAVFLTGALEDFLGVAVDPAVIWEHPSIGKLAGHLAGE
jgi:phthiocerol/phenolphthiocerol synthesis type-I polyketide synthase D